MSKALAIVLGSGFAGLGAATLVVALATLDTAGLMMGLLLCVTGMACLFYAESSRGKRSR